MYSFTSYVPKESNTSLGSGIETKRGVTQGKKSSANFFTLYVSDMLDAFREMIDDFMDPSDTSSRRHCYTFRQN